MKIYLSFLIMLFILFSLIIILSKDYFKSEPFRNVWVGKVKDDTLLLIKNVNDILNKNKIDYTIFDGTLLGSQRHGGFIPWDDDVDFIYKVDKKTSIIDKIKDDLEKYNLGYSYWKGDLYKVFPKDGKELPGFKWKYPFIDLFPFYDYEKEILVINENDKELTFDKNYIYPIKQTKFENDDITVNIPNNSEEILNQLFGKRWYKDCVSSNYLHSEEKALGGVEKILCYTLGNENVSNIFNNSFVINLDRRPDRLENSMINLSRIGIIPKKWKATDGQDELIKQLYIKLEPRISRGEMACALSHIELWKYIVDNEIPYAFIFEDDIHCGDTTRKEIERIIHDSHGFDVLFMGYCYETQRDDLIRKGTALCLHAYIVSNRGANILLDKIRNEYKFNVPIDNFIFSISNDLNTILAPDKEKDSELFGNGMLYQKDEGKSDLREKRINFSLS